jgi:hypothetical protein
MTFDEYRRRPVYRVQCFTWDLAWRLGVGCHTFRCLPAYRDQASRLARVKVAAVIRAMRKNGRGRRVLDWVFAPEAGHFLEVVNGAQ